MSKDLVKKLEECVQRPIDKDLIEVMVLKNHEVNGDKVMPDYDNYMEMDILYTEIIVRSMAVLISPKGRVNRNKCCVYNNYHSTVH